MAIVADAAQPADYYKSCEGKSGEALLKQLNSVVGSHTNVGYDGLWNVYKTSDVDANGKIWDMYSTKRWNTGEKCGNWTNAGSVTAKSDNFTTYSVPVKAEGNLYLRLRQTAGARGNIDNIAVTDYMKSGIDNIEYEDSWDAYCDADSRLVINNMGDSARRFTVYDIKGMVLFNGMVPSGTFTLSLTPGIYLVGSDVMVRRLVVY